MVPGKLNRFIISFDSLFKKRFRRKDRKIAGLNLLAGYFPEEVPSEKDDNSVDAGDRP